MTNYVASRHFHPCGSAVRVSDWDVDEVVVASLVAGDVVPAHPAEVREAVRILTRRGLSSAEIAYLIQVADRTVRRHRAALRGDDCNVRKAARVHGA